MNRFINIKSIITRNLLGIFLALQFFLCFCQVNEKPANNSAEKAFDKPDTTIKQNTQFHQIHTNLNGMVSEFVRSMYQDKKGNYWFGTNTNGIIRYDGKTLEKIKLELKHKFPSVRAIVEDKVGNVWFGTSSRLVKFDGEKFTSYGAELGLQDEEIWSLCIDKNGLIWVGTTEGLSHFDGKKFVPFILPETLVENPQHMLSDKLVLTMMEDKNGTMWFVTDGNGIFKYKNGEFIHLTAKNGLTDNSAADILEDKQGNIWIGTFYGGVSKYDGKTFTNFTKNGTIEGAEAYNFCEDKQGNIWFTAEGYGVYRYDGHNFKQFTTEDGLTSNVTQSIFEDNKGQLWFGSWQGLCIFDGEKFVNAKNKEPWTN